MVKYSIKNRLYAYDYFLEIPKSMYLELIYPGAPNYRNHRWKHTVSPCSGYKYQKSRKARQSQPNQKSRTTQTMKMRVATAIAFVRILLYVKISYSSIIKVV